jgi:DNA-binding Xre family transcriptional regulator
VIRSNLKRLRADKEIRTLTRVVNSKTSGVEFATLEALCRNFGCGVGDLREYVPHAHG